MLAFVEDVAASGGYWLAAAADEIYVNECSVVGSIGAVSMSFGLRGAARALQVEPRVFTAGRFKVRMSPFEQVSAADEEKVRGILHDIHATFIAAVKASRGSRLRGTADEIFEGDVHVGAAAVRLGLADGLGHVSSVARAKFGRGVRLVTVPPVSGLRAAFGGDEYTTSAAAALAGGGTAGAASAVGRGIVAGALDAAEEESVWAAAGGRVTL